MSPTLLPRLIPATDLQIWRAPLTGSDKELAVHLALLSQDEKARAGRFHFERDRNRYIFGRGILRTLLGRYLDLEPSEIPISYGEHGKPSVEIEGCPIQFNLAHSDDWAVYIFGWDSPVGIDLERIRPLEDMNKFAELFYSARESALINSLSGDQKWGMFYRLWTCKEAILKVNGSGLTIPLNQIEISLDNEGLAEVISIGGDIKQVMDWNLMMFEPLPGYQAAFAVQGTTTFVKLGE